MPEVLKPVGPERTEFGWLRALDKRYPLLLYWGPPVVWAALIFILSSQPGEAFPEVTFVPNADKAVHVLEYALLAGLVTRAFFNFAWRTHTVSASIVSLVTCFVFGVLNEFHQLSVPDRSFEWGDLGADAVGIGLGILIYVLIQLKNARRKSASREEAL